MSEIFVSYARSTAARAQQIAETLRGLGYGVWRDDDLPAHRPYEQVIEERLRAAKAVVVVWSADAAKSEWVQSEADRARLEGKLVQLSLDGAPLPMPFDRIQCADLTGWTGDLDGPGWRKVLASVGDLVGGATRTASPLKVAQHRLSVCVLPFTNMSGDPEQEYFSDGISEDVITDLSKVSSLFVVARHTAFAFKGKSLDLRQLAGQLGVAHVLEGSVRKAGGRVRITAQLIDGASGGHLWAERYDRDLDDIFALQDEISQAIVAALKLKLLPEEKKAIQMRGTASAEAYDLYLMARQYLANGNTGDVRAAEAILRLCRRATEIDPQYADAWALMSVALTQLHLPSGKPDDGLAEAERALSLNPNLADAHAVKARHLYRLGHQDESAAEIEVAVRLDPNSYEVNSSAGLLSIRRRRFEDAIGYYERATDLEETNFGAPGVLTTCYAAVGDTEAARRAAQTCLARVELALERDRSNSTALGFGASALAVLGEAERARDWIRHALTIDPENMNMRYNVACALCSWLKDHEGALELLGPFFATAVEGDLTFVKVDPDLDTLRSDPRFTAMLAAAEARLAMAEKRGPADVG